MKLTTLILLISLMQVSAATFGQRITINQKNISISKVFSEIKKQTGYGVFISDNVLSADKKIDVDFKETSLEKVMENLLGKDYIFSVEDNLILIKKREKSILDKISDFLASIDVHGTVVDEKGFPIPGATVRVNKGKSNSTITDKDGKFTLKNCEEGESITISFIGYDSKEIRANKEAGTVKLNFATSKLDEVQVIAYGETSQRNSVGNISSITAKQIENKPVQNVLIALQGEIPGLVIRQSSGYANSGISIQLQGFNSIGSSNDPFYVIDGVPFDAQLPSQINAVAGGSSTGVINVGSASFSNAGNPLNFINPQDIASVSVLKGADATAIYGSKAGNGAILITTRKGRPGTDKVDISAQEGFSQYPSFIKMMNRDEYLQMRRDAFAADGLPLPTLLSDPNDQNYDLNGTWDISRDIDWQRTLIGGTARSKNYNLSISGGTELHQYRLSGSYNKQSTVLKFDELNDQKISLSTSLNNSSSNNKFRWNFTANYQFDNNKAPTIDLSKVAFFLPPTAPNLYNSDGTLNWEINSLGQITWDNPIRPLEAKTKSLTNNLIAQANVQYELTKGLIVLTNLGYTNLQMKEFIGSPFRIISPVELANGAKPSATYNDASNISWIIEPQIKYTVPIGGGVLDFMAGGTLQNKSTNQISHSGSNYSSDLQLEDPGAAGTYRVLNRTISKYRYAATFIRANYNLNNRYLLNISARRDGSSRFGPNNLFHNFYSVGAGWIFTDEKFFKDNLSWLSFGKLRGSYGTTGNDGIGDYRFLNTYLTTNYPVNYQGTQILVSNGIPNPNLQWEETRKLDLGLEIGLIRDRLIISSNYYRNVSSNQLVAYLLPSITGGTSFRKNLEATIQNTGFELSLSSTNIIGNSFNWKSNLNLSSMRNKLLSFPNIETSGYASVYVVGQSIAAGRFYDYAGVNSQTGLYQFRKADGTITSDYNNLNLINDGIPVDQLVRFSGGLSNSFTYKQIELSILIDFVVRKGQNFYRNAIPQGIFANGGTNSNLPAFMLDYWRKPGDQTDFQRPTTDLGGDVAILNELVSSSNKTISDASYAKLRSVSVSYNLPKSLLNYLKLKYCSVFANGYNLLNISGGFKGTDPETSTSALSLPPLRTISFGARIGL